MFAAVGTGSGTGLAWLVRSELDRPGLKILNRLVLHVVAPRRAEQDIADVGANKHGANDCTRNDVANHCGENAFADSAAHVTSGLGTHCEIPVCTAPPGK